MFERDAGGAKKKKARRMVWGPIKEKLDCWTFILSYTQEWVIHLANSYCVPTVPEADLPGISYRSKRHSPCPQEKWPRRGKHSRSEAAQGARTGTQAPAHSGVGDQGPLEESTPGTVVALAPLSHVS